MAFRYRRSRPPVAQPASEPVGSAGRVMARVAGDDRPATAAGGRSIRAAAGVRRRPPWEAGGLGGTGDRGEVGGRPGLSTAPPGAEPLGAAPRSAEGAARHGGHPARRGPPAPAVGAVPGDAPAEPGLAAGAGLAWDAPQPAMPAATMATGRWLVAARARAERPDLADQRGAPAGRARARCGTRTSSGAGGAIGTSESGALGHPRPPHRRRHRRGIGRVARVRPDERLDVRTSPPRATRSWPEQARSSCSSWAAPASAARSAPQASPTGPTGAGGTIPVLPGPARTNPAAASPNEPFLMRLWQKGEAPSPCRGWVRGVGDRNEPGASSPEPPVARRDPASHPGKPGRLDGSRPRTRWGRGMGQVVGVDISQAPLDVLCLASGRRLAAGNDAAGIRLLIDAAGHNTACLVVMEASGGDGRTAHRGLLAQGRAGCDRQPETGAPDCQSQRAPGQGRPAGGRDRPLRRGNSPDRRRPRSGPGRARRWARSWPAAASCWPRSPRVPSSSAICARPP